MKIKIFIIAIFAFNFQFSIFNCSAQYTKLLDFNGINGNSPFGSLISDGTFLYGMSEAGGIGTCTSGCGSLFKIKPDGTGYSKLHDFDSIHGIHPLGSLVSDGTFLYGMTQYGGTNNMGTIFKIKPDGTGDTVLLNFGGFANAANPYGSLVSVGTFLYGMTNLRGTHNAGVIFKIKSDGTGYSNLHTFGIGTDGANPHGDLVSDGTFLYGMTSFGGTDSLGVIFKIKPDSTEYTILLNFNLTNGGGPLGSLIYDGTFLYGMTPGGGTGTCYDGCGVLFKIKPDGTGYSKLHDFDSTNGSQPIGSLVSYGTFLYGMIEDGGTNNKGVVFKIKSDGTGYYKMLDFTGANGSSPYGSLNSDGIFLYGMTYGGGTNNKGTVFKLGLVTGIAENNEATDFIIYPNPASSVFLLKDLPLEARRLEIYNVFGECVLQQTLTLGKGTLNCDLGQQPNGVYFLKIINQNGSVTVKKMVIQK